MIDGRSGRSLPKVAADDSLVPFFARFGIWTPSLKHLHGFLSESLVVALVLWGGGDVPPARSSGGDRTIFDLGNYVIVTQKNGLTVGSCQQLLDWEEVRTPE